MMKRVLRKLGALFLSVSMLASLAVNAAAVDAGANLPEEVSYAVSANAYSGSIGLEFGDDYADWIDAINGVEVNGEKYNDGNDSFFPAKPYWRAGVSLSGVYSSYAGIELSGVEDSPATVVISAAGYSNLTVELTAGGNDGYTAKIKDSGDGGEDGEDSGPAGEKEVPPTNFTAGSNLGSDFRLTFSSSDAAWLNSITNVSVGGKEWTRTDYSTSVWNNETYYIYAGEYDSYYVLIGEDFPENPAICVISADGYSDLTLKLNKENYTAEVVDGATEPEEVYSITVEDAENGAVAVSSQEATAGAAITVTVQTSSGYELDALTVRQDDDTTVSTEKTGDGYTFVMPAGNVTVSAAFRASQSSGESNPPTTVTAKYNYSSIFTSTVYLDFGQDTDPQTWLKKITQVSVDGEIYERETSLSMESKAWTVGTDINSETMPTVLQITEDFTAPTTVVISAEGYKDLVVHLTKTGSGSDAQYAAEIENGGSTEPDPEPGTEISLSQIKIADDAGIMHAYHWYFTFEDASGYIAAITSVSVNGVPWEVKDIEPSAGGTYYADVENNRLVFAINNFSSSGPDTLKSGDVITIAAEGYEALEFKFVLDQNGENPSVEENDGQGDHYELHVKLVGSFEAAIVGQEDYDGVSGATGGSSTNKNSDVTVYGALVEKGTEPGQDDWDELDHYSSDINIDGSKCFVSIVPDVANGTPESSESGMEGVYMTISSALTLSGTPKDPGSYLISITVADNQGHTATSNALPFRIYTGEEALAERLQLENLKQTQDGRYMWDIMEPWAIKNFGSNVAGEENSVRVPAAVKAWYGSHTSGTYGYLGYDIPWDDVLADKIPQTLYIPSGCDLTFVNMEILSSVRIVVENGGKLTLQDSVVQGIIEVEDGGTFSMNYNGYGGQGEFLVGSSLCGQLRLEDGAILENAAIYSHINYLANGNLADRTSNEPVVVAAGDVTVQGQVFIQGDEAGDNKIGQTGLRVRNGTLKVEDGAVLVVYGGDAKVQLYPTSGTAVQLDNGTITGDGKVVAVAGQAFWGDGGTAVSGTGTISTNQAFLQGATASTSNNAEAGKAVSGNISVTSPSRHVEDGTVIETLEPDPLEALYWKSGIDPAPPLDKFTTAAVLTYNVALDGSIADGIVTVGTSAAAEGDKVLVQPGKGYELSAVTAKTSSGVPIEVTVIGGVHTFIMPAADVGVSADYAAIRYGITYHLNGGVNASQNPATYTVEDKVVLQAPTKTGTSFLGWTYEGVTEPVREVVIPAGSTGNKSFTAHWENETAPTLSIEASATSLRGGGTVTLTVSGAAGDLSVKQTDDQGSAEKTLLAGADGTYSASLPNQTATYTFTATAENGTAQCTVSVTRKSGGGSSGGGSSSGGSSTTTTTEKNDDGSTTTTVTNKNTGTVTETTKYEDGSTLVVKSEKDGTVTTTENRADGVKIRVVDEPGEDVKVTVTVPQNVDETIVTVPVDVDYGMVAVDADTGEIISLSVPTEDGMLVQVDKTTDLLIVDNAKEFEDTDGHWAEDAIDYASAHELFAGTTEDTFAPDNTMTRAMLVTVLARFDGQDTTGGNVWYESAMAWAKENGISDGSNPNGQITLEQLATMLYRYAVQEGYDVGQDDAEIQEFADYGDISEYAREAMAWAVDTRLINGTSDTTLSSKGNATRAQVATILMRMCENIVE